MMTKRTPLAAFALVLLSSTSAGDLSHNEALALRQDGKLMPFESVKALVAQRHPGSQLLEVELDEEDGRLVYEIEILTADSTVRGLELDGANGAVLEDELED